MPFRVDLTEIINAVEIGKEIVYLSPQFAHSGRKLLAGAACWLYLY
jgi:hypothetical protein